MSENNFRFFVCSSGFSRLATKVATTNLFLDDYLRPPGGKGGISLLAKNLTRLIETAIHLRQDNDCIAVLHDADLQTESNRFNYERIEEICRNYRNDVVRVIARDEIEAWLLADGGVCAWLGISPQHSDEIARPKEKLNHYVKNKVRKDFSGPVRRKVLDRLDGTGDWYNHSLREALTHLNGSPCLR